MTPNNPEQCGHLNHDWKNLIRRGRAHYECPKCKEDVSMILFMAQQSGIDLTE
jgi:uncharacterized protein (UPF0212 family)